MHGPRKEGQQEKGDEGHPVESFGTPSPKCSGLRMGRFAFKIHYWMEATLKWVSLAEANSQTPSEVLPQNGTN